MADLLFKVANFDNTEKYEFTNVLNEVRLISGTFQDSTSELGEPVEVRFSTITKGTKAEIRSALRDVELIFARATRFFQDTTEQNSIWLYAQSDGSSLRRALVLSWAREDTAQHNSDPLLDNVDMVISNWTIQRAGYWEADITGLVSHVNTLLDLNVAGAYAGSTPSEGYHQITTPNHLHDGSAPGRIRRTKFVIENTSGAKRWEKIWFGMKIVKSLDTYFKPIESFDTTWGVPTEISDDITYPANSLALNDKCGQCDFSGSGGNNFEYKQSTRFPYYDGGTPSTPDVQAGTYLVLMRMRTTTGTGKFRVAMFQSWEEIDNQGSIADTYQDVFVESNEWHMYEMGIVQVPPEPFRSARRAQYPELHQVKIGYAAERLTPADGALQVDYLVIIPQEHALSLSNVKIGSGQPANIVVDEEDTIIGYTTKYISTWEKYIHEISATNWVWPADPARYLITVAAADTIVGDGDHELEPTIEGINTDFYIIPRYFSYNAD